MPHYAWSSAVLNAAQALVSSSPLDSAAVTSTQGPEDQATVQHKSTAQCKHKSTRHWLASHARKLAKPQCRVAHSPPYTPLRTAPLHNSALHTVPHGIQQTVSHFSVTLQHSACCAQHTEPNYVQGTAHCVTLEYCATLHRPSTASRPVTCHSLQLRLSNARLRITSAAYLPTSTHRYSYRYTYRYMRTVMRRCPPIFGAELIGS